MWRLILYILIIGLWITPARADSLSVLTWNMRNFPSGVYNLRKPKVEPEATGRAAALLRTANPDVLLLQEIRDSAACIALIDSINTPGYNLLVCSKFCDEYGIPGFQQLAIISRKPAELIHWRKWSSFGLVKPPRGFASAIIEHSGKHILVCNLHLKSNLVSDADYERGIQINILKRELAVQQLLRYISSDSSLVGITISSVVVAGDFNTNNDNPNFVSERTLTVLDSAGYVNCFKYFSSANCITIPAKDDFPATTFDYIFIKSLRFVEIPLIIDNKLSDHFAVFCLVEQDEN